MSGSPPRFTLIGGGLGGALLATYLGRAGYTVDLYERRPDPSSGNFVGGRSINLALSTRGIAALEKVGLADQVLANAIPMRGRMIHSLDGHLHFQPYDKDPALCINSVGRGILNSVTLAAAQACPTVRVHFNHRCTDVDLDIPRAHVIREDTQEQLTVDSDLIIGVDGAFSAVRRAMQRLDRFEYTQSYLRHGYKELTIPPDATGRHQMEKHALHIWPRKSFMMIALPNPDGSFTCTLFWQFDAEQDTSLNSESVAPANSRCPPLFPTSFASVKSDDDIRRFFNSQFPDAVPLMPTLLDDYKNHPTGSMVTIRCNPWHHQGKVALLGDAAHAVVPFYGQGMNAAFEDCIVLDECLRNHAPNWTRAFEEYEKSRKPNTDALADLAIENFIEMRDKTGSRTFRAYKKIDRTLHRLLPGCYTPLYTMISFTRIPYREAIRRAHRQNNVISAVAIVLAILVLTLIVYFLFDAKKYEALSVSAIFVGIVAQVLRMKSTHPDK